MIYLHIAFLGKVLRDTLLNKEWRFWIICAILENEHKKLKSLGSLEKRFYL